MAAIDPLGVVPNSNSHRMQPGKTAVEIPYDPLKQSEQAQQPNGGSYNTLGWLSIVAGSAFLAAATKQRGQSARAMTTGVVPASRALPGRLALRRSPWPLYSTPLDQAELDMHCDIENPTLCSPTPGWLAKLNQWQEGGAGSIILLLATLLSLSLANHSATSAAWLGFWSQTVGPPIAGHALSMKLWINEGLMAVFFFIVGLEIKQELRLGSLSSVKKALLPCIAAVGGMVTPMAIYCAVQTALGGSFAGLAVPMATDIAFAMAVFGFFRSRMPAAASAFLLTLAVVDDLGAIAVLASFASNISLRFLGLAGAITAAMCAMGHRKVADLRLYSAGGVALWWAMMSAGISADIAGVVTALTISTRAVVKSTDGKSTDGNFERLTDRAIAHLSPLSTFFIMPVFALANTAIPMSTSAAGAAQPIAAGIGLGLLLGKPLGIFGFTWLAQRLGLATMPSGMNKKHLGIVSMLGAIGFTMSLLLTEVSVPVAQAALPKLSVLLASAVASILSAVAMWRMPKPVVAEA